MGVAVFPRRRREGMMFMCGSFRRVLLSGRIWNNTFWFRSVTLSSMYNLAVVYWNSD